MLFDNDIPGMRISWPVLISTLVLVSGFFVVIAGLVFRTQTTVPRTGADGIIGEIGVVKEHISPEGKISVHGELWQATSGEQIPEGAKVRVTRIENLVLEVEPVDEPNP